MDQLLHRSATFRALLDRRVGKLLDFLKAVLAFFALVLVDRHGYIPVLNVGVSCDAEYLILTAACSAC
jgi:ABC-type anion transport system duplicated permease subunit